MSHTEIVDRPHVGSPELEEEEHLGRPAADPAHGAETSDDLLVVEGLDAFERHRPIERLRGEIDERGGLVSREPGRAKRLGRRGEDR